MTKEFYSHTEWQSRVASFGRLVDTRNFPDLAGRVLLGEQPAFLGRGVRLPKKHLDPGIIPALVFWTKGPVEILVENNYLRQALKTYKTDEAVVGIQLSVTGLGGSPLEPGIPSVDQTVAGLKKVLRTGLIDAEAITLRYDPILKVRSSKNQFISNASDNLFEKVIVPFAKLGVKRIQTKFLLFSKTENAKYHHVYKRMQQLGVRPISFSAAEKLEILFRFKKLAESMGSKFFTCCITEEHTLPSWKLDEGCLSENHLTKVGKRMFGKHWNRITKNKKSSRKGCLCSAYWDLSNIKGHKKCGSQSPTCLYCSASNLNVGKSAFNANR